MPTKQSPGLGTKFMGLNITIFKVTKNFTNFTGSGLINEVSKFEMNPRGSSLNDKSGTKNLHKEWAHWGSWNPLQINARGRQVHFQGAIFLSQPIIFCAHILEI